MDGNGRLIVVFLFTCILKFFSLLNSGMSAAWDPATTWTLGNYSTTVDALLSEVLNVQSEMSDGIVKFFVLIFKDQGTLLI